MAKGRRREMLDTVWNKWFSKWARKGAAMTVADWEEAIREHDRILDTWDCPLAESVAMAAMRELEAVHRGGEYAWGFR